MGLASELVENGNVRAKTQPPLSPVERRLGGRDYGLRHRDLAVEFREVLQRPAKQSQSCGRSVDCLLYERNSHKLRNGHTVRQPTTGSTRAPVVAFSDVDNSLGMGGKILQKISPTIWLLHLDDAMSYLVDDDENDVLMQIRIVPQ